MAEKETKAQRLDRELAELLQGLRVLLPGVQVLFAFLLTLPFTQRFDMLNESEQALYVTALVCAAVASAFLAAPSAFHRILFRERDKEWLVVRSNRVALVGTVFLAAAMSVALFLVVQVVYNPAVAAVVAVVMGLGFAVIWYVVPLRRRVTNDES